MRIAVLVAVMMGLLARPSAAEVLLVPSQYPTIQAAIDAAVDGDEVVLEPGEYKEAIIDFSGKAITLRAEDPLDEDNWLRTFVNLQESGGPPARSLRIDSGEGRDTQIVGLTFMLSSNGGEAVIRGSSPTFRNCYLFSSHPDQPIVVEDAAPLFENCRNPGNVSGFQLSLLLSNSQVEFRGSRLRGRHVYRDDPSSPSQILFEGCAIWDLSLTPHNPFTGDPDGAELPALSFEGCDLSTHPAWFVPDHSAAVRGRISAPGGFAMRDCTRSGWDVGGEFLLAVEVAGVPFTMERCTIDRIVLGSPAIDAQQGADVTIADCIFPSWGVAGGALAQVDEGEFRMINTRIGDGTPSDGLYESLLTGSPSRVVLEGVVVPGPKHEPGAEYVVLDVASSSVTIDTLVVSPWQDPPGGQTRPLRLTGGDAAVTSVRHSEGFDLECTGGALTVGSSSLLSLKHEGASAEVLESVVAGPMSLLVAQASIHGSLLLGADLGIFDSVAQFGETTFMGGEIGVYAERCTLSFDACRFESVNRQATQPLTGGAIIGHDTIVDIRNSEFMGCAAGSGAGGVYPQGTSPAIVGLSGNSVASLVQCTFGDAFVNDRGLLNVRNASTATLTACTLTASRSDGGPLLANASGTSQARFIQCLVVGNEADDEATPNPRSMVLAQAGALVRFEQCTIWSNTVLGNPFKGEVEFENSLIEGVTPYDPLFTRSPDDGGDRWYNSRTDTPAYDDAANNDYGDLRLLPGSPAIDAGDAAALPADTFNLDGDGDTTEPLPLDLAGNPRVIDDPATPDTGPGAPLDLGAYEFQPTSSCPGDCDANDVLNVDDIQCFAAGFVGNTPEGDCDGNGAWNVDDVQCFVAGFLSGCP